MAAKACSMGATHEDLAELFGTVVKTIYNWQAAHPEFRQAIKQAKIDLDKKVEMSLYEKTQGTIIKHKKPMVVSDGHAQGSSVVQVANEHVVPPDTTAMIFWLKNRQPDKWRDKQEITLPENTTLEIKIVDADTPEKT